MSASILHTLSPAAALLLCGALAACAYERPQSTTSPDLVSGVTSQNGGGSRALNNNLNTGITTQTGPSRY